jgi:lysyl endopeptidase
VKTFPAFDVQKLIDEDKSNKDLDIPFRFGKGFDTDITLNDGEWSNVEGGRLWSMEFQSKGAYSINFVFNQFYLPDGAELYISDALGTMLYGPVTSKQNTKNGFFLTDLV